MSKLLMKLLLFGIAGVIYLLTGRNRRQTEKIPEGMEILCEPPGRRYLVYALGVFVFAGVMLLSVLYIMDGAPKEARMMWALCVTVAIFILMITIWIGNMMAKDCIYFNVDYIQINRPFREPRIVKWYEIRRVGGNYKNAIHLYSWDETKLLTAYISMVNYERFCDVLKQKLKMKDFHCAVDDYLEIM